MYVFVTTAPCVSQGARRKTHIVDDDGNVLCGCHVWGLPTQEVTKDWLNQPDYYGELCQKCKKIANKKIK